ncbi:unnamed protein product [Rotaria sordida]|uniref:Uncharacterized protein n=1 Tax=Rotaria sordida TaxID=392033 RepID=A0A814JHZ7_9BILA|nr:unnamed protein product [Rotaria sordida]CAF3940536.1 unnamed protein product [Rotaria sordida]
MDEWRIQQQQQHHRMLSGGVGPILSYHSIRSRASPYSSPHQMSEIKQSYQYQQNSSTTSSNPLSPQNSTTSPNPNTTSICVKNDSDDTTSSSSSDEVSTTTSNPNIYTPNNTNVSYTPVQMEQIQQQRIMATKTHGSMVGYHPGQQQMMAARTRSMPYPMPPPPSHHHPHPSMYPHPSGAVCQCTQHMHTTNGHYPIHPSQHSMYYQQQQQQHEAWYRYQQQQQQQQAAWRQHQMQQQQQHLHTHPQPISIEQSYNAILSDTTSTTKLKTTKTKTKKKQNTTSSLNEEPFIKYQPIPPSSLNLSVQQQQQRVCIPPPSSTTYYPSVYSTPNSYVPAQQLPPPSTSSIPQDHPMYAQTSPTTLSHHQSQIFTSPLSNPGTPHQIHSNGEFNGTAEFGVPYHHGAPGSVNSLTDALCPSGDTNDRQMTPGPPSVGTPRVAPHQYSFPHTPLTPQTINNQNTNPHTPVMMPPTPNPLSAPPTPLTRPRSSSDQTQFISNHIQQYEQNKSMNNVDDLAAYLKDPTNVYLTDDVSSTFFDDIDALADTYLGQQSNNQQQANVDNNSAEDILLNFLCSDDLTA